jgi:hypothetical protein
MALFGASKRGLFGDLFGGRSPYQTPGIGDGLPGATTPAPEPQFEPGTGMFGGAARRPSKWDKFSDNMSNLAQSLGAAQAFWDGDFGTGVGIQQMQQERQSRAAQMAQDAQRQQQLRAAIESMDLTPQEKVIAMNAPEQFLQNYAKRFAPQNETEDTFTRSLRAAGIDPASPQGQELYRQRVSTMAQPAPNFIGDGLGGGRWVQPPAMPLPGGAPAPTQFNVGGEMLTPPRLGQMPTEPPAGAVSMLRSNPALRDQFDAKYGQGAAARYLGGQ